LNKLLQNLAWDAQNTYLHIIYLWLMGSGYKSIFKFALENVTSRF